MATVGPFSESYTTVKTCFLIISLRYFFTVESALELSKHLNKELKSGLIVGGSSIHALLATTTCKKKLYHQKFCNNRIAALGNVTQAMTAQGPEEMGLSLEHQNPSKTSEKMGYC